MYDTLTLKTQAPSGIRQSPGSVVPQALQAALVGSAGRMKLAKCTAGPTRGGRVGGGGMMQQLVLLLLLLLGRTPVY